jgi:hypothetical protein
MPVPAKLIFEVISIASLISSDPSHVLHKVITAPVGANTDESAALKYSSARAEFGHVESEHGAVHWRAEARASCDRPDVSRSLATAAKKGGRRDYPWNVEQQNTKL